MQLIMMLKTQFFLHSNNTAEVSYFGLLKGCNKYLNEVKNKENKRALEITHAQKKYQK